MAAGSSERGIVAGGDDEIAALAGGLAHLWPLGAVAIAAAAEERDHARACGCGHLARQRGQIAQGVVGVRVVDDDGERLAGIDGLEAAGNGPEHGNGGDEMRKRDAARVRGGEGREQIEDVHFAGETRADAGRSGRSFELDGGAGRCEPVARGAPIALADAVSANFRAGFARGCGKLFRVRIVRVEDGDARRRIDCAVEEQALGGEVVLHGLVVVEVVAREVGEDGDVEGDADHAALIERVAGNLGDELGGAARHAFGHQLEKIARLGRGVDGGAHFAGDVIFDGADENGGAGGGVEQRFGQECSGGFAVGAGDAGGGERCARDGRRRLRMLGRARGGRARRGGRAGRAGRR